MLYFIVIIAAIIFNVIHAQTISTSNGKIIGGSTQLNIEGKSYEVEHFLGIPFAEPPVGNLRFRKPKAKQPWNDVFNATKLPNACIQSLPLEYELKNPVMGMWYNNTPLSEDCLYLNIWRPSGITNTSRLPIVIWIYGGGFFSGSSSLEVYDGKVFASTQQVIVASMQYRVGILGFAYSSAYSSHIPGNQGLWDQLLAIKWIKENAKAFGGDPNQITLDGESAGSASVSAHFISDKSQDYFKNVIMQSATMLSFWSIQTKDSVNENFDIVAKAVGCNTLTCLENVDAMQLDSKKSNVTVELSKKLTKALNESNINVSPYQVRSLLDVPFSPIMDEDFFPDWPIKLLNSKEFIDNKIKSQKSIMMSTVKNEASFFLFYGFYNEFDFVNYKTGEVAMPKNFKPQLMDPAKFFYARLVNKDMIINRIPQLLADRYMIPNNNTQAQKELLSLKLYYNYDQAYGDMAFRCPVISFADTIIANGFQNLWMYLFNERTDSLTVPEWAGILHGYEIEYHFGQLFNPQFTQKFYNFTPSERKLSLNIMSFYGNFIKNNNPNKDTETWPRYTKKKKNYIIFESSKAPNFEVKDGIKEKDCNFLFNIIRPLIDGLKSSAASYQSICYWYQLSIMTLLYMTFST